jgi:16S rRNA G1207 methylase RsmC
MRKLRLSWRPLLPLPLEPFFSEQSYDDRASAARSLIGISGTRALDLYAGAPFCRRVAESFDEVTLVESDTLSLEAARENVNARKARFVPTRWRSGSGPNRPDPAVARRRL